jgi:hypothetical protein
MSSHCNPIHLPILVDPKCGSSNNNCHCDGNNNSQSCQVNCDNTVLSFSSQGTYQNECLKSVPNTATLPIASLSNVRNNDCVPVKSIKLNTICLPWCDFLRLFYTTNSFRVNVTDTVPCAVYFSGQTYQDTSNPCIRFNLTNLVKTAWEGRCNAPFSNLPLKTLILLEKDTSTIKSLYTSASFTALSLDEIIDTLITNGDIVPADSTSSATVVFAVEYIYYFKLLDIAVQVNFNYRTAIPCYKNTETCDNWCPTYPNCGNCGLLESEKSVKQPKTFEVSDTDSSIGGDDQSRSDIDTFNEQMKELMNKQDDKSFVSFEDSKW